MLFYFRREHGVTAVSQDYGCSLSSGCVTWDYIAHGTPADRSTRSSPQLKNYVEHRDIWMALYRRSLSTRERAKPADWILTGLSHLPRSTCACCI